MKKKGIKIPLMTLLLLFLARLAIAQVPPTNAPTDTIKKVSSQTGIKSYKDVVPTTSTSKRSFFDVHQVKDRYLLEIPDSLQNREILAVTRIDKGAADFLVPLVNLGYSGDEIGRVVVSFDRIPGDRIAMRSISFSQFAHDTTENGLSKALGNNMGQAIQAIFPIKASNEAKKSTVIDITDFLNSKAMTDIFTMKIPLYGNIFTETPLAADRSYVKGVTAFPLNIEIGTTKTISKNGSSNTLELNTSMLLLPKVPMKPRIKDPRVGYFSNSYVDYDKNPHGVAITQYIQRWRMEPKAHDIEKYKRGELVEPQKPIIIYIDPATPKKWVPYLIAGINDWQPAFEKAGFKNAIIGLEAPTNDTTWSIYDARHSAIIYKPSAVPNASGPNVNDPRSGEILETHINWYHEVMKLIQNWYIIQAGATDPRTHKPDLDDELMGQLIRFVSSHEVGHTLGLAHNFGASSTVPVENLRNKAWVEANGHTPSIMDYARFNYVAQPEDGITEKGMFPRIGDYDKWAIEWGYKWLPQYKNPEEERPYLNKWIIGKLASGKQYFYGSQLNPLTDGFPLTKDPRSQSEDLGDDAVLASEYGIKNLKRIVPNVMEWYRKPNLPYDRANEIYDGIVAQFQRYIGHVSSNIGGIHITPKTSEQDGSQFVVVPKAKQKHAIAFLHKQLFETPYWLINEKLYMSSLANFTAVAKIQEFALAQLLSPETITRLLNNERDFPKESYPAAEMLADLGAGVFSELKNHKEISNYRRDLQNFYIELLVKQLIAGQRVSTLNSLYKAHAKDLATAIKKVLPEPHNRVTKQHLNDIYERLEVVLQRKNLIAMPTASAK